MTEERKLYEDAKNDFVTRRQKLGAVLVKATADFLDQEGGLRLRDIRESFETALQLMVVAKIARTPHPSRDRSNDGQ